ncbi:MAG: hypothetical protein U0736_10995 [Gemmataceae bacterium]
MSDADVAYRPLFSDTRAAAGQTWYYRVTARNAAGASRPSNVVGPVRVRQVCLVDELQDFSRVHARSERLQINNDYNALYAEYLFRARGTTDDHLVYRVPGAIESVKVVAFHGKSMQDLSLQVSPDGEAYTDLRPRRSERRLPSPPGGAAGGQRRTLVEYQAAVPAGNRFLRLRWNGPTEVDRVEIYHPGGK